VLATTLAQLEPTLTKAGLNGPALTFLGLAPRDAVAARNDMNIEEFA
jgi:uroporphyrin-III C-methyltransferase/precorrin-2 dehydrogenase/sirohydrochlorin ferrochelatase